MVDPNTVRRIARLAGVGPADRVVEVGPGLGALTLALAETGASVTAVEIDHRLAGALREVVDGRNVRVVEADALTVDWETLLAGAGEGSWVLVANLPYNVATPLVADILDTVPAVARMLVMVQREVADRLAAGPGDAAYGAVSVKVAYWADARVVGRVPAAVFLPQPKVESALVEIVRRPPTTPEVAAADRTRLFTLVAAGFRHRRKMLRGALAGLVDAPVFAAADVSPSARAEELGLADWARLALCSPSPGATPSPTTGSPPPSSP